MDVYDGAAERRRFVPRQSGIGSTFLFGTLLMAKRIGPAGQGVNALPKRRNGLRHFPEKQALLH